MTELIELVQKHDPGSELVSLFELTFNGTTIYFHPGLDENLTKLYFEEAASPYTIKEYDPFPIEMTGVEYSADGATNRPSLTVANVTSTFSDALGGLSNQDLIGSSVVVRQTLAKYLSNETAYNATPPNGSTPIEFPKKKFILDRVSSETPIAVTFEVSSPYDLQGIKVPNRQIIGKYCSWVYQGVDKTQSGGCTWREDGTVNCDNGSTITTHKAYFDKEDNPLVTPTQLTSMNNSHSGAKSYTTYAANADVDKDSYYEHSNTVWKALVDQTANSHTAAPQDKSSYWLKAEVCGKTLNSCKCRFQFMPYNSTIDNSYPKTTKNTEMILPFGSFPGTKKFR